MKKILLTILLAILALLIFTFGVGLIPYMIILAFGCGILFLVGCFVIWLVEKAIIFSKISFSLLTAFFLNANIPILENYSFLSFLIWVIIAGGIIFSLCMLPRVNCAFKFSCTALMTYLCAFIISGLSIAIITSFSGEDFNEPSLAIQIILKSATVFISAGALLGTLENTDMHKFKNFFVVNIDRLLASAIYAFAVFLIGVTGTKGHEVFWQYVVPFGGMAVAFIIDVIFTIYTRKKNIDHDRATADSKDKDVHAEAETDYQKSNHTQNTSTYDLQQAMALFMIDDLTNVTLDEIKAQRNRLIKTFHPDHGSSDNNGYVQKINAAYEALKEHLSR